MLNKIVQIWKVRELRNNILYVLGMLTIFRLAAHIPVPGVDVSALQDFFSSNQILGLLNVFSGGSMQNFSIVMMGIGPYITASIIFQLLGMIVPKLEEMQKEESGRSKINMWTRWLTVPLAAMQAFGMITLLRRSSMQILGDVSTADLLGMVVIITAGTVFLMWIGELITEKNIGLLCDLFWYICVSPKDKRTTKKCHKLFYERHILSDYSSAYKTRFDIKVVTDLKMNRSLFDYATCLMPLTISVNDIESGTNDRYVIVQQMNQEIRQRVWNYCVKHNIRYSPRLHVEVWGPKRGV